MKLERRLACAPDVLLEVRHAELQETIRHALHSGHASGNGLVLFCYPRHGHAHGPQQCLSETRPYGRNLGARPQGDLPGKRTQVTAIGSYTYARCSQPRSEPQKQKENQTGLLANTSRVHLQFHTHLSRSNSVLYCTVSRSGLPSLSGEDARAEIRPRSNSFASTTVIHPTFTGEIGRGSSMSCATASLRPDRPIEEPR